jgi:hypothetical protein
VPVASGAAGSIAGVPVRIVPDSRERPDIAGGCDAVILGPAGVGKTGLAGGASDRCRADEGLEFSRVGEPGAVVADLGQQPGAKSRTDSGERW